MRDPVGDALAAACADRTVLARLARSVGDVAGPASAESLAGAEHARRILARIAGPLGEAARGALAELAALDERDRRVRRATWSAGARAPAPPGLRGIDASWIEHALSELPARAREALASGASDPAGVWLVRRACAAFAPMPAIDRALERPRAPADVAVLAPAALRAWLEDVGADQLAYALGSHAHELIAARRHTGAAGRAGDAGRAAGPSLEERLARAIERIGRAPRAGQLGERRGAIERAKVTLDEHALIWIGARAVAPHLASIDRQRLVLRLPRDLGSVLADELRAHAIDECGPTWAAVAAPCR